MIVVPRPDRFQRRRSVIPFLSYHSPGNSTTHSLPTHPPHLSDDIHYPVLTVQETLDFALKMKTPRLRLDGTSREEWQRGFMDNLLKTFGIEHTRDTLVGE